MNWREYWNGPHPIYVNARHRTLHFNLVARDIAALVPGPDAAVLDYGCGEADAASEIARHCAALYLYDTAPNVRASLRKRFDGENTIHVLDDEALDAISADGDGTARFDMIVVNSVVQYLSRPELDGMLKRLHDLLKPDGLLAIGDVIHVRDSAVADTRALLNFAWRGGFLFSALAGIVRTVFSGYSRMRKKLGLSRYTPEGFISILRQHGFDAHRASYNIGHNQGRMLFIARPAACLKQG